MTLVHETAQRFWSEDLAVIEKRYLKGRSVTDLPTMPEEWRVPNQGSVLAFSTVNIDAVVGKPGFSLRARAVGQYIRRLLK